MAPKSLVLAALLALIISAAASHAAVGAGSILLYGTARCSFGSSTFTDHTPVLNADVRMKCGGDVVAGTTADVDGAFIMKLEQPGYVLTLKDTFALLRSQQKCLVVMMFVPEGVCGGVTAGTTLTAPIYLMGATTGGLVTMIGDVVVPTVGDIISLLAI